MQQKLDFKFQNENYLDFLQYSLKRILQILDNNQHYKYSKSMGDTSHSIDHMIIVCNNAYQALRYDTSIQNFVLLDVNTNKKQLVEKIRFLVLLAALLHDIDDRKLFPKQQHGNEYANAQVILDEILIQEQTQLCSSKLNFIPLVQNDITTVLKMISLVSASKNGDYIPDCYKDLSLYEWLFIPRYADRVEAIGLVGIKRCYQYTKTCRTPFYTETTIRANNEKELFDSIATVERYTEYRGISETMIDHYYDKILRLSRFPIQNLYLLKLARERNQVCVDFVLKFGQSGTIDINWLESL